MTFEDILKEYNIPYFTEGKYARPNWINFNCPFCSGGLDPNKPYAGYNKSGDYINCWRCAYHSVTDTLMELTGLDLGAVSRLVRGMDRVEPKETIVRRGKLVLPKGRMKLAKPHRRYLASRGFDPLELQKLWNISGIGIAVNLSWRVFIPIFYRGVMVSWTTRSIDPDAKDRYISASPEQEAVNHKELLYGEDYIRQSAVIVEGPSDVWRIGPGAVAVLGTQVSTAQLEKIAGYEKRTIIFDPEPAAQERAKRLCDQLEVFSGDTSNVVLETGDPGEAEEEEILEIRRRFL